MICKKIKLDANDESVYLDVYIADIIPNLVRKAILILPGGGYEGVCSDREGEPVALAFLSYGYNAFVLHYSVHSNSDKHFPEQLIQASLAMKYIRDHADEYSIDSNKVFVAGFSAGGHLAACLGTMWNKKEIYEKIDMSLGYNKPAGMILVYPVILANETYGHMGSFYNLWGVNDLSDEHRRESSAELHVSEMTCPAYIVHTSNDNAVHVKNALAFADAFAVRQIPFELHIYYDGPHGMALGNSITKCGKEKWENASFAKWVENAVFWANQLENKEGIL